ncbi:hypothetical protein OIU91_16685 [Streptomyces sp. NBC_01456]|uniref:hypothetical protein n=1 Tax=Streptomyces sp. NBC_01456 TaxID=2975868 RepID=UPI002E320D2A|nr:hypothetical protein [Streptomyces sp. NBC_01456]
MSTLIDEAPVVRYRVMTGEDTDPARRGAKQLVAQSTCSMHCPDQSVFERTIEALRQSDEQLRARPENEKFYDWQSVYFDPEIGAENGAGTLVFGVAWYDEAFFAEKGSAYMSRMHTHMFSNLGVPADTVKVEHWRPVVAAA